MIFSEKKSLKNISYKNSLYVSLLSANQGLLKESLLALLESGCTNIHMDIMDGHYVPGLTFGAKTLEDLQQWAHCYGYSQCKFHVHFMVKNPEKKFLENFLLPNVDTFIFHGDSCRNIRPLLEWSRQQGKKTGLAFSAHCLGYIPCVEHHDIGENYRTWPEDFWNLLDEILIMSVLPGKGGQAFQEQSLMVGEKLRAYLQEKNKKSFVLGIDGGINPKTYDLAPWANYKVVGSFLFPKGENAFCEPLEYKNCIDGQVGKFLKSSGT